MKKKTARSRASADESLHYYGLSFFFIAILYFK